jgi:hypothetical protein
MHARRLWLLGLLPLSSMAASVYLNGVNIDGVTSQRFDKASVRIDEKGNVYIEAKGYAVKTLESPPPAVPAAPPPPPAPAVNVTPPAASPAAPHADRLTRQYWLVSQQTSLGMTDFNIDVYVNAKWIRQLGNSEDQVVQDITKYLVPGKNRVLLAAHKLGTTPRKSYSVNDQFQVVVGAGNMGGDNVLIDDPVVRLTKTAADDKDSTQEFTFETR